MEKDEINEVFKELIKKGMPEKIISNFVVVAEINDSDGAELHVIVSDGITPWTSIGLLQYAMDMVAIGEFNTKEQD